MTAPNRTEAPHLWKLALEATTDTVLATDAAGRIVLANQAACDRLGYSHDEFSRLQLSDVQTNVASPGREGLKNTFQIAKDGSRIATEVNASAVELAGAQYVVNVGRDLRDRVRLDSEVFFAHDQYQRIFHAVTEAVLVIDPRSSRILDANQAAQDLTGFSLAELQKVDRLSEERLAGGSTRAAALEYQDHALMGRPQRFAWAIRGARGDEIELEISLRAATIFGEPRLIAVARDMREHHRLERDLARTHHQLDRIADAMTEGLVIHSATGEIVYANPAASTLLGLTQDQLQGRTSFDPRWGAIRPDGRPWPGNEHPAMVSLVTGRPVLGAVMGIQDPAQGLRWLLINAVPLFHDGGTKPTGAVATFVPRPPTDPGHARP